MSQHNRLRERYGSSRRKRARTEQRATWRRWLAVTAVSCLIPAIASAQSPRQEGPQKTTGTPAKSSVASQESKTPPATGPGSSKAGNVPAKTAQSDDPSVPTKRVQGRLPNFYGKIGISLGQRQRIYSIQSEYRSRIEALQAQIAMLEKQTTTEVEEVLTDDQRMMLKKLVAEAEERRRQRSRK